MVVSGGRHIASGDGEGGCGRIVNFGRRNGAAAVVTPSNQDLAAGKQNGGMISPDARHAGGAREGPGRGIVQPGGCQVARAVSTSDQQLAVGQKGGGMV